MTYIIILFGLATLLAGVVIVINPEAIFGVLRKHYEKVSLHVLAVVIRVVLGILLIFYASESKFPIIIEILGWLSLVAAFIFAIIGRQHFLNLMNWAFSLLKTYGRVGGVFAMVFGGFLVYAFV